MQAFPAGIFPYNLECCPQLVTLALRASELSALMRTLHVHSGGSRKLQLDFQSASSHWDAMDFKERYYMHACM